MNTIQKTIKAAQATVKIVATIAAITATAQNVLAADTNKSITSSNGHLKIVPTLGYTYFNIQGADLQVEGGKATLKSKSGSSIGALVQMPMMDGNLELESGLEYMETGAKTSADFGPFSIDLSTIEVGQMAIPLRAKYVFDPASTGTRWYGKAGLTPTYVISAKIKDNVYGGSTDIKSEMNEIGLLTQAGIGADWSPEVIPGRVNVDFTYSHGLMKAFKNAGGTSAGFQLQAGYSITL